MAAGGMTGLDLLFKMAAGGMTGLNSALFGLETVRWGFVWAASGLT